MSLLSRVIARMAGLRPPSTRRLVIERRLRVPMRDGVTLLANRYAPAGGDGLPIILIRTPYGQQASRLYAEIFAERGYQVVVQSCRGTFGSGGVWRPFQTEREDGLDTMAWLRRQGWYGGRVGMYGPSYMGFVQWAIAADCPDLGALAMQITASRPRDMIYAGGAFSLRTMLAWTCLVGSQAQGVGDARIGLLRPGKLARAYPHVPLGDLDAEMLGAHFPFYQDLLRSEAAEAPLWAAMDFSGRVAEVVAPCHFLTGWYDIFLLGQLEDYRRLWEAGRRPEMVIGPWGHTSPGSLAPTIRESLRFFDARLRGTEWPRSGVRIFLMGAGRWLELPDWPPPARERRLHLQPGGKLADALPAASEPDAYRYDPRDPTPDVGGTADPGYGARDNRRLEARPDVLTYTTAPLPADLEVVGQAAAELWVRSSLRHTDFCARLCDVGPSGRSTNVCDGLLRLQDSGGRARIDLWPTAYRFRAGHRLRLQVCSGAYPRFDRNLGGGESIATARTFHTAEQRVFHDPDHPSALLLPVVEVLG